MSSTYVVRDLRYAIQAGRTDEYDKLFEQIGSSSHINDGHDGWTALHGACWKNCKDALHRLLAHPYINPNIKSKNAGYTPLMVAIKYNSKESVNILLSSCKVKLWEPYPGNLENIMKSHDTDDNCFQLLIIQEKVRRMRESSDSEILMNNQSVEYLMRHLNDIQAELKAEKVVTFSNYERSKNALNMVSTFRTILNDVIIICQGVEIPSHKLILAARSDAFKAMLTHNMNESSKNTIEINEVTPKSLTSILDYFYTGKFPDDIEIIPDILYLIQKYLFKDVKGLITSCEIVLLRHLNLNTAISTLVISNQFIPTSDVRKQALITLHTSADVSKLQDWNKLVNNYPELAKEVEITKV